MSDLRDLYQSVILDHYKKPRNFGALPDATGHAEGVNPLCGDHISVHVRVAGGRLEDVRFEGSGCAISKASGSLMTEIVKGKEGPEIEAIFRRFHGLLTGGETPDGIELGKLEVLSGVREFPTRVKCATLAWHALRAALDGRSDPVTTEAED
jgi:nitrogen fixation NifU-like protein